MSVLKELFVALGKATISKGTKQVSAAPVSMALRASRISRYSSILHVHETSSYSFPRSQSVEILAALLPRGQATSAAVDV
jgi:hypothetical protein